METWVEEDEALMVTASVLGNLEEIALAPQTMLKAMEFTNESLRTSGVCMVNLVLIVGRKLTNF
eukprot:1160810-Pelagomonas_calceolata.AAC.2